MKIENDYQYEDFEQNQNNKNTTPKNLNAKVRQHRVHTNMFMEVQFFFAQMKVNCQVSEFKTIKSPSSKFNFPLKSFCLPIIISLKL